MYNERRIFWQTGTMKTLIFAVIFVRVSIKGEPAIALVKFPLLCNASRSALQADHLER